MLGWDLNTFIKRSLLRLSLDNRIKVDSWSNEINVSRKGWWDAVFLASEVVLAGLDVLVHVVLSVEEGLGLFNGGVKTNPVETLG